MEDDDEFGDLYTDVLRPIATSVQSQPRETDAATSFPSRSIDRNINSDDEEILYGASDSKNSFSNSTPAIGLKLNAPVQEKLLQGPGAQMERGVFDLNLEASRSVGGNGLESEARVLEKVDDVKLPEKGSGGLNFMEEDDDLNIVVEERENKDDHLVLDDVNLTDRQENMYNSAERNENMFNFMGPGAVDEMDSVQMIPGLSGKLGTSGGSNFDDEWESDESEDDLQIVLNDNNHGPMGMERKGELGDEDDEEGDPLVIVADNGDVGHHHHHQQTMTEEQEWGGEEGGAGADAEKKDLGDAAKASGGGGTAALAAAQPKVGYSNHVYNHPFHSQFKYVRPGAAPIPGTAPVTPGVIQGQVRPPITMGVVPGRGRGDWRQTGIKSAPPMQKGFHSGYGAPAWGANAAGRGYGSGLDFTLPSHKTIFEVDIDGFEDKPWRLPGIDVSDFFNFGLNEESWKSYCKQLEQLRLETTMQSKIRVYESGRAEQDYDPDLPPELAAAVGIQDIPSDNTNSGKGEAGPTDLARASARGRPPVQPIGRPIPVEAGSGDRLPSIDTRRPRMHDSDVVIEIVCQSSTDNDDMAEQQDNDLSAEVLEGVEETDDLQQDDAERTDLSHAYNGQKGELSARRAQPRNNVSRGEIGREDDLHFDSEVPQHYHPDREIVTHEERSTKERRHVKSPKISASDDNGETQMVDDKNELSDSEDGKQNQPLSSSCAIESDGEQAVAAGDDANDESVMDNRSFDMEREEITEDATTRDALEDGKLLHSRNKQKVSSHLEQFSKENDDGEDSKTAGSSENSKPRSESSKDNRKFYESFEDEVLPDRHRPRAGNVKGPIGDDENARRRSRHERDESGRHHVTVKGKEDSHLRRGVDPNSSLHRHMKSDGADWRKESDISEGSWRRRDEHLHGRRIRVEDTRKREHGGEIGSRNRGGVRENERSERDEHHHSRNQLDNGSRRRPNHEQDMGSRQRDRDDNLKTRNEKADDLHNTRRKEGAHVSRGHAEKEDITHDHRESSSRRKRERDDSSDQRNRDDHAKLKDDNKHYVRQKEDGSLQNERGERQRDRDEWHRLKQSHEETVPRREREETRPVMRSGRLGEDRTWITHPRGKDDYKGSGREYHPKDVGRHSDQLKRRDRVENEIFSQHRGHEDVYARGNQSSNDEKRARHERPGTSDERVFYASDTSRLHEHKQKEGSRKSRQSESGDQSSLIPKRNQDEHSGQISETMKLRGRAERGSGESDVHVNRQSSRKHGDEASSDDEQTDSRKGRSKLERWTSHKERDFGITSMSSSSLKKNKDRDTYNSSGASMISRIPEEPPSKEVEDIPPQPSVDDKDTSSEMNNANAKVMEDKHLDTVEKLKKRSERFKLPMPSEKEAIAIKKMESEPLPCVQTETRPDSEIKPERPARKRRWTGN